MENKKLVGAYVPLPISNFIELFACAMRKTKSQFIRDILLESIQNRSTEELEKLIITDVQLQWHRKKPSNKTDEEVLSEFLDFLALQRGELELKIPMESVDKIIQNIKI